MRCCRMRSRCGWTIRVRKTPTEASIRGLTPREQYAHYLQERNTELSPDQDELDLFESLLIEVTAMRPVRLRRGRLHLVPK